MLKLQKHHAGLGVLFSLERDPVEAARILQGSDFSGHLSRGKPAPTGLIVAKSRAILMVYDRCIRRCPYSWIQ
jgi:hypothetical protein